MNRITPLIAIKLKCKECTCGSTKEVRLCPIYDCSLYPYRFGTDPTRKKEITEDQKEALCRQLKKANKKGA